MISKRVEKAGAVEVSVLFNWTAARINELKQTAGRLPNNRKD
ncbi:MAG TPA: hypothetical protein VN761_06550 [Candidatus Polarisedimenticolia bacterium]|nr:hypothetical protein [Candidatus Polarisedimenticolia bacterium]